MPVLVRCSVMRKNDSSISSGQVSTTSNIYIMRHGERIDNTFENWISNCVTEDGQYTRSDSNMPVSLPKREGSVESFRFDSPLTNIGAFEAKLIGESFAQANVNIRYAYSSPALRCVQTCHNVFRGLGIADNLPIKIEPGLFEWVSLYADIYPAFMTVEEFINAHYFIDENYQPTVTDDQLKTLLNESSEEYYQRCFNVMTRIINDVTQNGGGNVLVVAHGSSLDTCSRQLIGSEAREGDIIGRLLYEVPYCGMIKLQQENNEWKIVASDVLGVSHTSNREFDFKVLQNFH